MKNKDGDTMDNQQQYCCRTIMGLAGEIGLQYIESAKKSTTDPKIDTVKWNYEEYLAVLEKETEVGESGMKPAQDYKLLAQGKMNALQFHKKCMDIVLKMGIKEKDAIEIMVRNAFVLGITSHMAYDKIMALKHVERTSTGALELTRDAEEAAVSSALVAIPLLTAAFCIAASSASCVNSRLRVDVRSTCLRAMILSYATWLVIPRTKAFLTMISIASFSLMPIFSTTFMHFLWNWRAFILPWAKSL